MSAQSVNDAGGPSGNSQAANDVDIAPIASIPKSYSRKELEAMSNRKLAEETWTTMTKQGETLKAILRIQEKEQREELKHELLNIRGILKHLLTLRNESLRRKKLEIREFEWEIERNLKPGDNWTWAHPEFIPSLKRRMSMLEVTIQFDKKDLQVYGDALESMETDARLMYWTTFRREMPDSGDFSNYPGKGFLSFHKALYVSGEIADMPMARLLAEISSQGNNANVLKENINMLAADSPDSDRERLFQDLAAFCTALQNLIDLRTEELRRNRIELNELRKKRPEGTYLDFEEKVKKLQSFIEMESTRSFEFHRKMFRAMNTDPYVTYRATVDPGPGKVLRFEKIRVEMPYAQGRLVWN